MTRREFKTQWLAVMALTCAALAVAGRADAQDTRTKIVISQEIIDSVLRSVDRIVAQDIGGQIDDAIRAAVDGRLSFGAMPAGARQNRDFRITQEARETKTMRLGTAGALELRNIGGNITVSAVSGSDATIEIVRTSRGRTDADAKLGLERVQAEIDQRGDRATVSVRYPDERQPPYSVSVAFHVKAPAGTRVTITNMGGDITVTDIKGDLSTNTHGGNTTVTNGRAVAVKSLGGQISITGIDSDGSVEAETLGGDVELKQIKAKRLHASTIGGNVTATDITSETADLGTMGGDVSFAGVLAKSGRYELHTNGGDVRFQPTGSVGYELQASTFAGEVRTEGITLQLQGASTGRGIIGRSLRGTVGDGSALVILRTFSGTVTVGKKQ